MKLLLMGSLLSLNTFAIEVSEVEFKDIQNNYHLLRTKPVKYRGPQSQCQRSSQIRAGSFFNDHSDYLFNELESEMSLTGSSLRRVSRLKYFPHAVYKRLREKPRHIQRVVFKVVRGTGGFIIDLITRPFLFAQIGPDCLATTYMLETTDEKFAEGIRMYEIEFNNSHGKVCTQLVTHHSYSPNKARSSKRGKYYEVIFRDKICE